MADNKRSQREAALIAQARASLGQARAAPGAPAKPNAAAAAIDPAAPGAVEPAAIADASPAPAADHAERITALMAAARAESERRLRRQRQLYVWAPVAFISVLGLWTLLWLWHKL